ncbi:MAG TPA: RagB/SusD family nutrient uptake outer membrane protein [Bacteroidales bacterium]|nr:RagB/SusD family nutrient uptake outer membrane protein [Bacteroidales bacterium]
MRTHILPLFIGLLIFTGCQDFLDIRPEGTVPSTGMDHTKSENIFLPVSAAYASLRDGNVHSFAYIGAFEITSDNADKGSSPGDNPEMQQIDKFTYTPSNGLISGLWTGYFNVVSAANNAIQEMPLFEAAMQNADNKAYTRQCAGESKTIRAYAYFNLTRMFGKVPLIDSSMTAEQLAAQPQASTSALYTFIEKDLQEAIEVLPASYSKDWAGRITKYTAMALKAKVHMYQNEWDSVAVLTDRIMASGRFGLLDNFREVFSVDGENSKESLFEIQSSTLGRSSGDMTYLEYAFVQGPRSNTPSNMQGWGFCTPSDNLIQFFTTRKDSIRAATTLLYRGTKTPEGDSIKSTCTNPVYNGKVYTPSALNLWNYNGYGFEHNVRILRYADVLLMYAEAYFHGATSHTTSGHTGLSALNEVRKRAGLTVLNSLTLDAVWDERRAELAMEEDRFFDLVRSGRAASVLSSQNFVEGKNNVFPIPATQMQLNHNLVQNPLYN